MVADKRGEIDSGGGGHCSRGLTWWNWELGGYVMAGDGGGNGGSG